MSSWELAVGLDSALNVVLGVDDTVALASNGVLVENNSLFVVSHTSPCIFCM